MNLAITASGADTVVDFAIASRRLMVALVALLAVALAACSGQPGSASPSESAPTEVPESPTPSDPTPTPTVSPAVETSTPTATPFGASVFDDPDDCEHSSGVYRVAFPDAWWWNTEYEHAELGRIDACQYFSPNEFDITTASREQPAPDGIAISISYIEEGCIGFINPILAESETTVDGHSTVVREFAEGMRDDNPPATYQYVVNLAPDVDCESGGQFIVATTGVDMLGAYEDNKATLDQMMETMEIREP